jgi:hypothetical protein
MTQSTILSSGPINAADTLTIQLIQPDSMPAVVRIVWPTAATITTPDHYLAAASAAIRLLAEASTADLLVVTPRRPSSITIRRGPHDGCARRTSNTAASITGGICRG